MYRTGPGEWTFVPNKEAKRNTMGKKVNKRIKKIKAARKVAQKKLPWYTKLLNLLGL